jgi:hypothetical protein
MKKHLKKVVAGLVVTDLIFTGFAASYIIRHNTAPVNYVLGARTSLPSSLVTKPINKHINAGGLDVEVRSATRYPVNPSTQLVRYTISTTASNSTDHAVQFTPWQQVELITKDGAVYGPAANYVEPGTTSGGDIRSGETTNKPIDFEINPDKTPTKLIYQEDAQAKLVEVEL